MKVLVASTNPIKISASKQVFKQVFPDQPINIIGKQVNSGISAQPISDKETFQGAKNRTIYAMQLYPNYDYYVGIEAGVEENLEGEMFSFSWVVVQTKEKIGLAKTVSFMLPNKAAEMIRQDQELGEVMDTLFEKKDIKYKEGAVGLLTKGIIDRTSLYTPAVICALIPFTNPKLFSNDS